MDFKEINRDWVKALRVCSLALLGIPTLSYTWMLLSEVGLSAPDRSNVIWAFEAWFGVLRWVALFILGFVTFGYTWVLLSKLDGVFLWSWRRKWLGEKRG